MIAVAAFWSFVLVVGLLTVTPGLDTPLIVRTAAVGAARQAWGVVAGIQTGTLMLGAFASAGLAACWPRPQWPSNFSAVRGLRI